MHEAPDYTRVVFDTSGPRIVPRFFGDWDFPADLCDQADMVGRGYRDGVPMGGDLAAAPADAAPTGCGCTAGGCACSGSGCNCGCA